MSCRIALCSVLLGIGLHTTVFGDIIDVPGDYSTIQAAINSAVGGDEVVVADGTYTGNGNRDLDFGGKLITVRSANGPDNCIIDCQGSFDDPHRGFIFQNGETEDAVVEGFTIRNGSGDFFWGGGIHCDASSPTISGCMILDNTVHGHLQGRGGGIYSGNGGSPTIIDCTINGNAALGSTDGGAGGGIYLDGGTPSILNSTISGNSASWDLSIGGGIYCHSGSPTISGCTVAGNQASFGGGLCFRNATPTIADCAIIANTAAGCYTGRGGGMYNLNSSPAVTNCTFTGNSAWGPDPNSGGGGMYNNNSSPWVTNCTFSGNDADNGTALAFDSFLQQDPSDLSMTNCILWDGGGEVWNNDNSVINIAYSDVQGGWPGEGNIDLDPLFVESGFWDDNGTPRNPNDDFWVEGNDHLLPGSPCIDAGDNTAVPDGIITDLDGNPRFVDDPDTPDTGNPDGIHPIVDMGAYEFGPPDLCADDDGDGRVTICHSPPGNPDNARTITVRVNAVPVHLAHGDYCGVCQE